MNEVKIYGPIGDRHTIWKTANYIREAVKKTRIMKKK